VQNFSMPVIDARRPNVYLFIAVVVFQVVIVSAQVTTKSGAPVLEAVAFGALSELQRAGAGIVQAVTGVWTGYADLRGVKTENERLARELGAARIALQQERSRAQRTRTLEALLELRGSVPLRTAAADVIAAAATPEFRTITLGKGAKDGLRPDMAVIAPAGVVGRVIVPAAHAAKVQLLIDRSAAVGALIERTRAQGVATGSGEGVLALEYVSGSAEIAVGDTVVTSGIDGIYPKGFVIGWVEQVKRSGGAYGGITVRPAVDFSSLEEVLVVLTPQAPDPTPAGATP
jgi:rod shape-determining protein MreC